MNKKKTVKDPTLVQQAVAKQQELDSKNVNLMEGTVAGEIWNEIKDKKIEMFALPDQFVCMHCHPVVIEPSKLYLLTNSSAVLPSLETAIGSGYSVEKLDKFVAVSKVAVPLTKRF